MLFSIPVNLNDSTLTGSEKAPLIIAGGCRHGAQEAQHPSSALDLPPLPRQQMESCTPSQIGSCVLSKTVAKALVPASSSQQSSSQTTYQTMERSFSQVPDVLPPEPPIQLEIPIEAEPTGRGDSHPLPHYPHIIHDVPSSLGHEVEAKIATQHGLHIETNQEVLDTEVSPLINALPELEYPMMDSEVEGSETYVDKVDPEKEDEGEECVGVLAEATVIDRDEVEGLLANDTFEEEMDVSCVDEVSMCNEADKSVMQQIRLDEEVCVDFGKMPIPVQLQEKRGEEDKTEDEVEEEDCPSSPPSVYASPKASISSIKSQVDPHRCYPETPKYSRRPSIPQSLDQINIDMSSLHNPSEETVPIVAQLTTLSDSESESEVDELAPSEPRDSHKDLEEESTEGTIAKDQTVAAESSFQQENNSIHSSETIGHGVGDVIEEELEYAEMRVNEPLLEIVDRTFSTQSHPVRQPEHLYSHNMQPTPVVSPVEVITITLPGDVSSVNTPSPGRFPTFSPVLDTRGGLSRKRKLEEINIGGTVEQSSLGSESQMLGDRIRSTKDASPSIVGCKQQDILPVSRGVSESRSRDENQEGRTTELIVDEREGSPMYISSGSSSPTSNKIKITRNDDFLECIDLTDSPPIVKVQAGLVDVMKQEDGPSSSIQAPSIIYPEGTARPRTKRGKRRPKGWEKFKKRMAEAEKEIIDFGAEASDEPDIRPVRRLGLSNGVAEQASEDTNSANGSTTIPTINLTTIRTRQEQNEKRSKATTRIKRRQRITNQNGSISSGLIEKEVSDSDRPSKRTRTELRDIDVKPLILSASAKQKKPTKEKSLNAIKEAATKQMQQPRTADETQGSSNRIKWPLKKTGEMHNKNVSCQLVLLPGIDDSLVR